MPLDRRLDFFARSLRTMAMAVWLLKAGIVLLGITLVVTVLASGYGFLMCIPIVLLAGVLWLAAAFVFWIGKVQSLLAAGDERHRWLLGGTVLADALLLAGAPVEIALRGDSDETLARVALIVVTLLVAGIAIWLDYARRTAHRLGDSDSARRFARLEWGVGVVVALVVIALVQRTRLFGQDGLLFKAPPIDDLSRLLGGFSSFLAASLTALLAWSGARSIAMTREWLQVQPAGGPSACPERPGETSMASGSRGTRGGDRRWSSRGN